MDFDQDRIYYSHQNLQQQQQQQQDPDGGVDDDDVDLDGEPDLRAVRRHLREFLRNYRQAPNRYVYRERLLRMHRRSLGGVVGTGDTDDSGGGGTVGDGAIEVDLAHVGEYDAALLDLMLSRPAHVLPPFEAAAADALRTLLRDIREASAGAADGDGDARVDGGGGGDADGEAGENADPNNPDAAAPRQFQTMNKSAEQQLSDFHGSSVQVLLRAGNLKPTDLRQINASHMNRLLRCPGIVISASRVRSRASSVRVKCHRCLDSLTVRSTGPFSGMSIPGRCRGPNPADCGQSPYQIFPDECGFVDQQTLKLQECPEAVPTGEMPRSLLLAAERGLVDRAPPGTRVSVIGIASLFTSAAPAGAGRRKNASVRTVYLRVVGMHRDDHASGDSSSSAYFTPGEEEAFRLLSRRPDIYGVISRSIAPSISGSYTRDIKRALACLLFGGSHKRLPDGMKLRGDINVLLMGDPSTAKSQFLKFIHRVAPIGVYTSGKGSSAAGLTASVVRDARGEFYLEGGAMVLADGGVVCIDEFDKMRPADRVAIHEAMEQQTISVAKAGITTVLNSRTSVLAAANPVYGRYDDMKSASENIDLMTTILSRFDLIFLVRDVRDEDRDREICRHVMGVHMSSRHDAGGGGGAGGVADVGGLDDADGGGGGTMSTADGAGTGGESVAENATRVATSGGELDIVTMKKYVQYCRAKCSPRLSEQAGDVLASSYVKIRDDVRRRAMESSGGDSEAAAAQAVIPITVRQLEALVRLSESLAKMRLSSEVHAEDVAEALRLFKVSTMAANSAGRREGGGSGSGGGGGIGVSREELLRVESFLKSRLVMGAMVNKQRIIEEAASQGYDAMNVTRVIGIMVMRGEIQERNHSRLIKRIR